MGQGIVQDQIIPTGDDIPIEHWRGEYAIQAGHRRAAWCVSLPDATLGFKTKAFCQNFRSCARDLVPAACLFRHHGHDKRLGISNHFAHALHKRVRHNVACKANGGFHVASLCGGIVRMAGQGRKVSADLCGTEVNRRALIHVPLF